MPDYRMFAEMVDQLPPPDRDSFWMRTWEERGNAVRSVLGETYPPRMVHSFAWKDYILPGACALTFKPTSTRDDFLYMTLGLTQPVTPCDSIYPWEFSVRAKEQAEWPIDLLYQLLTQWHWMKGEMWFGYRYPLVFFTDRGAKLWAGITDEVAKLNVVGAIRYLYLWTDELLLGFKSSTGEFGLLSVIGVTEDEDRLAQETTPAHLMLLLRRMGVEQVCDPYRCSVLLMPGASLEWENIKYLPHDDALRELHAMT